MKKLASKWFLWYLKLMAQIQLLKMRPMIIGVGGASGKTSLANFVSTILKDKFRVLDTKGKNSQTGIPISILGIKSNDYAFLKIFYWVKIGIAAFINVVFNWKKFDILVAEMGVDSPFEPKNMSYLLKIIKPKLGVLTNIALEHSEYFDSTVMEKDKIKRKAKILEATRAQEALLLQSLPKDGLAVLNIDDFKIVETKDIKASKLTVSLKNKNADFFAKNIDVSINGFKLYFIYNKDEYILKIPTALPTYYAYSFLMAIAISTRLGFSVSKAKEILEKEFSLPPGRMSTFEGKKNTTIIDSSYNSSPSAIGEALELLNKIANKRRKVAIIGDMRELGSLSKAEHESLARQLIKTVDLIILIGPQTAEFSAPILAQHKHNFFSFRSLSEAKITIENQIREKDIILVKGSQNTLYLERAVEMLLKDKKDALKLCRRGKYWDKKRSKSL
ncbi:MAG TPA: Mur ligase family protein [Patescibacteria group bacterium]|nr:Mur ligase family protein [Patescibacteria group bacterium]